MRLFRGISIGLLLIATCSCKFFGSVSNTNRDVSTPSSSPVQGAVPINRPLRIMPLGASITQGVGGTKAGTRGYLHTLLENAKFPHVFVGSNTDQPGDLPPDQRNHEGHPGWTIDDIPGKASGITPRTDAWVRNVNPDIILILIGNNDIGQNYKTNEMGARLNRLLDIINNPISGAAPNARVLVATLPLIGDPVQEQKSLEYQRMMRTVVANMKGANRNIDLVDVHAVFTPADKADNFHPNDSGHQKIAKLWFDEIMKSYAPISGPTGSGAPIVSRLNNLCIDIPAGNFSDGVRPQMWECNGSAAQKWRFEGDTLRVADKCLEVAGANPTDGTPIQIASCNGDQAQRFTMNSAGDLVSSLANKCVDIDAWNRNPAAQLILWPCTGNPNQKWDMRR